MREIPQTGRTGASHVHTLRARNPVPVIGLWVPTASVHLAFLAVAAGLCLLVLEDFWLAGGLLLAVTGTFLPNRIPRWWVMLLLGLGQLWRQPSVTDVAFYVLLAGVHLLHVIAGLARQIPWSGRVQVRALVQPLQRFVLVQVCVQAVSVGALLMFGSARGTVPGLSIFAAAMLGVVAVVLGRELRPAAERE